MFGQPKSFIAPAFHVLSKTKGAMKRFCCCPTLTHMRQVKDG